VWPTTSVTTIVSTPYSECAMVAVISRGMWAVKLCSNKILPILNWGCQLTQVICIMSIKMALWNYIIYQGTERHTKDCCQPRVKHWVSPFLIHQWTDMGRNTAPLKGKVIKPLAERHNGYSMGHVTQRSQVQFPAILLLGSNLGHAVHIHDSVTKHTLCWSQMHISYIHYISVSDTAT